MSERHENEYLNAWQDHDHKIELFEDMLDEAYPSVIVAGIEFYPSQILKECDPIAYREAFLASGYANED